MSRERTPKGDKIYNQMQVEKQEMISKPIQSYYITLILNMNTQVQKKCDSLSVENVQQFLPK